MTEQEQFDDEKYRALAAAEEAIASARELLYGIKIGRQRSGDGDVAGRAQAAAHLMHAAMAIRDRYSPIFVELSDTPVALSEQENV